MKKPTFEQVDKFTKRLIYVICIIALGYFISRISILKN